VHQIRSSSRQTSNHGQSWTRTPPCPEQQSEARASHVPHRSPPASEAKER
jgi:hypothetical protein